MLRVPTGRIGAAAKAEDIEEILKQELDMSAIKHAWRCALMLIAIIVFSAGVTGKAPAATKAPAPGACGAKPAEKSAKPAKKSAKAKQPAKPKKAKKAKKPASAKKPKPPKPPRRKPPVKKVELTKKAADAEATPTIAHVRISGTILNSLPDFSLFGGSSSSVTLRDWLHRLAAIRKNPRITAVALEIGSPAISWAQAQELSDAIRRLNEAKPVYTHMTQGGATPYLLASAGGKVSLEPVGRLMITGLAAEFMFFRGTLDLLDIKPQFIQIGRFKGASEPFARKAPSKEFLGEYNKLLDDLYAQLCGQIASQRKLKPQQVKRAIDSGPFSASSARRHKLVDRLDHKADWPDYVKQQVAGKGKPVEWLRDYGKKSRPKLDLSNPFALLGMMLRGKSARKVRDPSIAIIHADGMIVGGQGGQSLFGGRLVGSTRLVKCFEEATNDDRIKAVVFRINSPGGSALASELIYQAVKRCAKTKPVIASIGQTGASGGYYIAVGADTIIADPAGITGSIGVVSGKLALSGLMKKIGIGTYEITRGKNAGLWMSRPWTKKEQAVIRKLAQETYNVFAKRVKESRGKRIKNFAQVSQGRVFTARQASRNGLIDKLGGLREAVALAKKAAKIEDCGYITLPRPKTLMDMLAGDFGVTGSITPRPEPASTFLLRQLAAGSEGLTYLMNMAELLRRQPVLTIMPYYLSVGT